MKVFLRGLLLLIIGVLAGYFLGVNYPDYGNSLKSVTSKVPFLNQKASDSTEVAPADSTAVDSLGAGVSCLEGDSFHQRLMRAAENIEARRFAYVAELGQDCSGIFHKMKDSVILWTDAKCEDSFNWPEYETTRSSRALADWYYQQGNLKLVEDPMAVRNEIKPGSVMFYSKPGRKYSNLNIDMLTARANNYNPGQAAIMHIGIVVDVTLDEEGNIIQYTLMHGRNEDNPASRTDYHKERQNDSNPNLPKFGNWSQQWVAIADVATPSA